ncbi:MAG: FG-GAP-like repeat-containing protein [Ignavibacteria bacterium]|nr:FG-GAP-like repeat-containing protein [Ignavibacteria bacterium]
MKNFSLLLSASLILLVSSKINAQYLYKNVTSTNLPISTVSGPGMDVESADIDNDGDKDIIIAREYAQNKILINQGNGMFVDESWRIPQFSYDSEDIVVSDFDRDGDIDILFASEDNAVHEFYLNRGDGYFDNANNRIPNFISNAVITIDLNNDNYPDLIFGSNQAGNPSPPGITKVLINNGNATFRSDTTRLPSLLMVPQDIKAADIDRDGDLDFIFGCEDGNKIFINNGSGYFTDETTLRLPVYGNEETRKVTLSDVDSDGDLDIFFANVSFIAGRNPQDRLLLNNGSGIFTDVTGSSIPFDNEHTMEGLFLDFNFDGKPDLITSNVFVNRPVKAFVNQGGGVFSEVTSKVFPPSVFAEGLGMKIDFFNNDTLPDIYVVHRRSNTSGDSDLLLFRENISSINVNQLSSQVPEYFKLHQNFPNPFNPETEIRFSLKSDSKVVLEIYDVKGNFVENLIDKNMTAGYYSIKWKPDNLSSGVYLYKLTANGFTDLKRMAYIK